MGWVDRNAGTAFVFNSMEKQQTVKKMIANDAQLECGDPQL